MTLINRFICIGVLQVVIMFFWSPFFAQQQADSTVMVQIASPRFVSGNGPVVYIDEMHNNFHTIDGRFRPFSILALKDGYRTKALTAYEELSFNDILVIANPISTRNMGVWRQPIYSAFNKEEIQHITDWVKGGGRLLLIADHMPFSGAADTLANAFGFAFCDGFARLLKEQDTPDLFSKENGRLIASPLTDGSMGSEISSITTFTGSSFTIPEGAQAVLKFKKGDYCLQPEVAWQFNEETLSTDLEGSFQGAIMRFGKGKLAVFAEGAMFTAQTVTNSSGTFHFGFNAPDAPNNIEFIRNVLYWLSTPNE